MDAFFARNRLHAYLDGSLSSAEAEAVAAAIARDPALRAEHEQLRQTLSLVQRHGRAAAPMGLHDKVMAQVAAEPAPGGMVPRLRRLLRRTPVEAVALLAAAAALALS
jgi:anti-sigma factor RsiW